MVSLGVAFTQDRAWDACFAKLKASSMWRLNVADDMISARVNALSQARMLPRDAIQNLKLFLELYRVNCCTELSV